MYAAQLAAALRARWPDVHFFGAAGPRLREQGVDAVVRSESLAVVGLAEVVGHLPRIYGEYRKLVRAVRAGPPDLAILTDSPDFHLRLARHLKTLDVPVYYLVAPQVWAWRQGRVRTIRERVDKLLCLFPFEEPWFRERGVDATYIGHPLAATVKPALSREAFFARHRLDPGRPLLVLLPGSRAGEANRHLPVLLETVALLRQHFPALQTILATPKTLHPRSAFANFWERFSALSIQTIEGETWDCLSCACLALAASGTVTVEAAVLGTPLVTFYKVSPLTWWAGRHLVKVPYLSMVNLIAGRLLVPELIQNEMTPRAMAHAAVPLLADLAPAAAMRAGLAEVRRAISAGGDPLGYAAGLVANHWEQRAAARLA